jgi:oligoendopeptidase F
MNKQAKTNMETLKWNLDDILKTDEFENLNQEILERIKETQKMVSRLSPNMPTGEFAKIIEYDEETGEKLSRLNYLPHLLEAVDQKNQIAKLFKSKADQISLQSEEVARKISHWIKGKQIDGLEILDDKNATRLFAAIPDLEYQLNYSRKAAKYTLNEAEEDIISNKDVNGIHPLKDLRGLIETEFEYKFQPKGKKAKIIKTQSELMTYVHSANSEDRKAAYLALLNKQKENIDKFFLIYQSIVRDWDYETKLRGFKTPISVRNFRNQIPDEAVETLLSVCSQNRKIFQRFFHYKAQELGIKKLSRFDIYAPVETKENKISFEEAKETVLSTINQFSPDFYQRGKQIFEDQHIDTHPSPVKRSGAFCATVSPKISPYILLNFTGQTRDIFTLAHELGHGIHSLFANDHFPSTQSANLPLAETASTLSEMILFEKIFENEKDRTIKKSMLMEKMADSYASILRQNYFVIFETEAHKQLSQGITYEKLSDIWFKTLTDQFEDSVEVDPIFRYEWSYIPHIVNTPFYCYAYNFGELLSYALFARYKQEGKPFIKKIESILMAGGSQDPKLVLNQIGIDIEDKKLWQDSFKIIEDWQNTLEKI